MAKKYSGSSVRGSQVKKSEKFIRENEINFSDIPELSEQQLRVMKPVGRPLLGKTPRKLVAVRIDQEVLKKLRQEAKQRDTKYQSLINEILARHVKKAI